MGRQTLDDAWSRIVFHEIWNPGEAPRKGSSVLLILAIFEMQSNYTSTEHLTDVKWPLCTCSVHRSNYGPGQQAKARKQQMKLSRSARVDSPLAMPSLYDLKM
ncbi:unnamed protein product [Polarella glacialis]|uniref:Uncharacterized protein n=1 Tax=Polarella glacialis TaxID=89957 RepID=A0A813LEJ0_POLGL|nr:unnamed protein product [Polarella glacialis]